MGDLHSPKPPSVVYYMKANKYDIMREKRREEILRQAKDIITEKGIGFITMKAIAAELGMSRQTLYKYYGTIEELLYSIQIDVFNTFQEIFLANSVSYTSAMDGLKGQFNNFVLLIKLCPGDVLFTAMFDIYFRNSVGIKEKHDLYTELIRNYELFYDIIVAGQKEGIFNPKMDARLANSVISNIILSAIQRLVLRGDILEQEQLVHRDELLHEIYSMVVAYLTK